MKSAYKYQFIAHATVLRLLFLYSRKIVYNTSKYLSLIDIAQILLSRSARSYCTRLLLNNIIYNYLDLCQHLRLDSLSRDINEYEPHMFVHNCH